MNRIRELREEKAMTQYQLGKCLNVQNTTISMYERGQRELDTPTINTLCNVLQCSSDYLLGRSEVREPIISDEDALRIKAFHALPERDQKIIDIILSDYMPKEKVPQPKTKRTVK